MNKPPAWVWLRPPAELLDHLPDDSTLEDIHYHLYVLEKTRRGETRAKNEDTLTQDDVEVRLRKLRKTPC